MPTPEFRATFPVLAAFAYLNAGTCGPVPAASAAAMREELERVLREGRGHAYYDRLGPLMDEARAAWGRLLNAPAHEFALTSGASDGIARALAMVDWQPGDVVVTSDEEHPGVLGPLGALLRRHGVAVRQAPWDGIATAAAGEARLIVVSHVSWLRGRVLDLAAAGDSGVPILVDGAQSAGAIPVDLAELRRRGVVAYASAGQKWTCGPVGTGSLWVDLDWAPDGGHGIWPTYGQLEEPHAGLLALAAADARRFDTPSTSVETFAGSVAALGALEAAGWAQLQAAAIARATSFAAALRERGLEVAERGESTLVAWRPADPQATVAAALAAGVIIRDFPQEPWVRASIGGWTSDADLDRLLAVAG